MRAAAPSGGECTANRGAQRVARRPTRIGIPNSFNYVAGWSNGDVDLVKETADRVTSCAKALLGAVSRE